MTDANDNRPTDGPRTDDPQPDDTTPMTDEDTLTDGGQPSELAQIQEGSTHSVSTKQRLRRTFDRYLFAPMSIAWSDWRTRYGGLLIIFMAMLGTVGVAIVPEPSANVAQPYTPWLTNWEVPLGTTRLGSPVGRQVVHATPAMLKMAIAGAIAATGTAVILGTASGYKGGRVDRALMQLTDIFLTIPGLPLVVLLAGIYQPESPFVIGLILAIDNWPGLARAIRSQVLTVREESYVEASRVMGASSAKILRWDIVPQLMPYITINAAGTGRRVIFESAALYFLGLLPYSQLNWGVMMQQAYANGALANLAFAGHWLIPPMLMIMLLSFGLVLFAQGLDRVFNPRLRAMHAKTTESTEGEAGAGQGQV